MDELNELMRSLTPFPTDSSSSSEESGESIFKKPYRLPERLYYPKLRRPSYSPGGGYRPRDKYAKVIYAKRPVEVNVYRVKNKHGYKEAVIRDEVANYEVRPRPRPRPFRPRPAYNRPRPAYRPQRPRYQNNVVYGREFFIFSMTFEET